MNDSGSLGLIILKASAPSPNHKSSLAGLSSRSVCPAFPGNSKCLTPGQVSVGLGWTWFWVKGLGRGPCQAPCSSVVGFKISFSKASDISDPAALLH